MDKPLKQSKTFWFNLTALILGALGGMMGTEVISSNPEYVGYFTSAIALGNIVLRLFTKTSIKG